MIDTSHPLLSHKMAIKIISILEDNGYETRFVGGCVRDYLLKRTIKDIDLATTALPNTITLCLNENGIRTIPTGITHGTITAMHEHQTIEITTLRQDTVTDGRHAHVQFTIDWYQDSCRRDFTMNALSLDRHNQLYDYHDGIQDIEQKNIRFIGDANTRITEDYLRILRYYRFCVQLGWAINTNYNSVFSANAVHLKQLSRERIQQELFKILSEPSPNSVLISLYETTILQQLITFDISQDNLSKFTTLTQHDRKHKIVDPLRRLMCLFSLETLDNINSVIVLSNQDKKRIQYLKKDFPTIYHRLYFTTITASLDWACFNQTWSLLPMILSYQRPDFPLKAEKLMQALPHLQGKALGTALDQATHYWLDNNCDIREKDLIAYCISNHHGK